LPGRTGNLRSERVRESSGWIRLIDFSTASEAARYYLGLSNSACDYGYNDDAEHTLRAKSRGLFPFFLEIRSVYGSRLMDDE